MTTYSFDVLLSLFGTSCFMSGCNCYFLTCVQVIQEASQVVWYSHLLKNFPQFTVIHTVKGFDIVNKEEIDVFLELSCFFHDPADVGNLAFNFYSLSDWLSQVLVLYLLILPFREEMCWIYWHVFPEGSAGLLGFWYQWPWNISYITSQHSDSYNIECVA